jgi:predicted aldo/keto reductase-like oxidoreductase
MAMQNYLGKDIKKLGFGLMRPPFTSADGDTGAMKAMIDAYMAAGFSYFDTSYIYGLGVSENHAKEILVERYPQDAFQFATKLPVWILEKPEDMAGCLNTSLERTSLGYIDFYMLHGLSMGDFKPLTDEERTVIDKVKTTLLE